MKDFDYHPPDVPLSILYEDRQILVLDKPTGLLSVPGKLEGRADCLESRLRKLHPHDNPEIVAIEAFLASDSTGDLHLGHKPAGAPWLTRRSRGKQRKRPRSCADEIWRHRPQLLRGRARRSSRDSLRCEQLGELPRLSWTS